MVGRNIIEGEKSENYVFFTPNSLQLDLLNRNIVDKYIAEVKPDIIIHCAGLVGGIQANIANPVDFLVKNTQMGINVIMSAFDSDVKEFINMSSSCVYPKDARNPLTEDLILNGKLEPTNEGYALAKITATKLCQYINSQDLTCHYKTVIPCNLYGKYDKFNTSFSHMLPAVIKKVHEAKYNGQDYIDIWGDGSARREFMYVEDLADFIYFALENFEKMPENINVGIGHDYSINEYYSMVASIVGFKGHFLNDLLKPTGMKQKLMDNSKQKEFGWAHKTTLREGVQKAYNYYLNEILNDK